MKPIHIRKAKSSDAPAIARLHASSWRNVYKDVLPADYLENGLEEERLTYWAARMKSLTEKDFIFLAVDGTDLIHNHEKGVPVQQQGQYPLLGFIAVCDVMEDPYEAMVENLHVLPEEKRRGIGSFLLSLAAEELQARKKGSFFLWVFDDNAIARSFYEKMGGIQADKGFYELAGRKMPETRYYWPGPGELLKHSKSTEAVDPSPEEAQG